MSAERVFQQFKEILPENADRPRLYQYSEADIILLCAVETMVESAQARNPKLDMSRARESALFLLKAKVKQVNIHSDTEAFVTNHMTDEEYGRFSEKKKAIMTSWRRSRAAHLGHAVRNADSGIRLNTDGVVENGYLKGYKVSEDTMQKPAYMWKAFGLATEHDLNMVRNTLRFRGRQTGPLSYELQVEELLKEFEEKSPIAPELESVEFERIAGVVMEVRYYEVDGKRHPVVIEQPHVMEYQGREKWGEEDTIGGQIVERSKSLSYSHAKEYARYLNENRKYLGMSLFEVLLAANHFYIVGPNDAISFTNPKVLRDQLRGMLNMNMQVMFLSTDGKPQKIGLFSFGLIESELQAEPAKNGKVHGLKVEAVVPEGKRPGAAVVGKRAFVISPNGSRVVSKVHHGLGVATNTNGHKDGVELGVGETGRKNGLSQPRASLSLRNGGGPENPTRSASATNGLIYSSKDGTNSGSDVNEVPPRNILEANFGGRKFVDETLFEISKSDLGILTLGGYPIVRRPEHELVEIDNSAVTLNGDGPLCVDYDRYKKAQEIVQGLIRGNGLSGRQRKNIVVMANRYLLDEDVSLGDIKKSGGFFGAIRAIVGRNYAPTKLLLDVDGSLENRREIPLFSFGLPVNSGDRMQGEVKGLRVEILSKNRDSRYLTVSGLREGGKTLQFGDDDSFTTYVNLDPGTANKIVALAKRYFGTK